ncbi:MAG TPA: AraC family transcriptional regulator [Hyphomicrobium sp.]|nr:AraC family transcriptional regulator [Hyphomicrobium sp.]
MTSLGDLVELIARHAPTDGTHATAISPIWLYRASRINEPIHALHEPSLCIVAQGRKRSMVGDTVYVYDEAKYLVISVDVPIISQLLDATPERPFLCMRLRLDPAAIAALMIERNITPVEHDRPGPALVISDLTSELIDASVRMLRLLDAPNDISALAPLIEREILYRLVNGEQTYKLGHIAFAESKLQQVSRAIAWIKRNYKEPFSIEAAAAEARMSASALHVHFKAVTTFSPLQFQKQLRLQEARRLILAQSIDAAAAAFSVGYESPSQFSREYRRLFGSPPARDGRQLRERSIELEDV